MEVTLSGGAKVEVRKRRNTDETRAMAASGIREMQENDPALPLFVEFIVRLCVVNWSGLKARGSNVDVPVRRTMLDRLGSCASDDFVNALGPDDLMSLFVAARPDAQAETHQGN